MLQTRSRRPGRAPAGKRRAPELARVLAHLAIIMDGNGRWAWHRLWPRVAGHRAGLNATLQVIEEYVRQHIGVLTLFAFSSENWQRSAPAVDGLMDMLLGALT
ncbi:MAG: undecaprenyl diphosphate synthase family protein, partial [Gammaproteobacteria bacterium]